MSIDRKAAVTAWKERKSAPGIYAIRCVPSDDRWLGQAADLATVQNRHWFALRMGSHTNRALQAAWAQYGAEALVFEARTSVPTPRRVKISSSMAWPMRPSRMTAASTPPSTAATQVSSLGIMPPLMVPSAVRGRYRPG
jgi:hypothetical protein